jgi:hypothetical protein
MRPLSFRRSGLMQSPRSKPAKKGRLTQRLAADYSLRENPKRRNTGYEKALSPKVLKRRKGAEPKHRMAAFEPQLPIPKRSAFGPFLSLAKRQQ